jgi:hypothetical protein
MNDHWNVVYQVSVFYADRKSKMAAIAGQALAAILNIRLERKTVTL